jgi:uncharacterized protein
MNIARIVRHLALALLLGAGIALADEPVKVVYQFSEGLEQASRGLANVRNHLAADPTVRIVVVAFGQGIDFMLDGARDRNGNPYLASIDELSLKGVEFEVCENTLKGRRIDRSRLDMDARIVPAGVAEIARLQSKEGYAYIKP